MLIIPDPQIDFQIPNLWQRLCIYTYGTPVAPVGGGQFSSLNALLFRFSEIIRLWSITLLPATVALPPYYSYRIFTIITARSVISSAATQNVIGRATCIHCDGPHSSRALNIKRASKS
jgi:hypothetical protein